MRPALVVPLLILGLWFALSWWGERGQRLALQETQNRPTVREELLEKEIRRLTADTQRLEREYLVSEQAKQRAIGNLGQAVQLLQKKERSRPKAAEMDPEEREQVLESMRQNLALVRRINRGLQLNGGGWLRILSLEGVEERKLNEVMLSVVGQDGLYEGAYLASSCRIHMDRESGEVRLVLGKGTRFVRNKKVPFDEGFELSFESHWPRIFAKDLHELITSAGEWPKPKQKPLPRSDLRTVMQWRDRLDGFFEALSVTGPRLELQELKGVGHGDFEGVSLFGYSKTGILERRLKAQKMEFWIDKARDRVELRLTDGYVEDESGRVGFPKKTWRMFLPTMGARQAGSLLAGFVHYASPSPKRR